MSLIEQIQQLAQESKYQPWLNYLEISSIEILKPSEYEDPDPEHPEFLYYFKNIEIIRVTLS